MTLPHDFALASGGGSVDTAGNDVTLAGVISGVGNFDKAGAGTLSLLVENTYGGNTSITGGTLAIAAANRLNNTPLSIAGGATLRTTGGMTLIQSIDLTGGTGTIDTEGNSVTVSGQVLGSGSLTKAGTGTLTLTSNNVYGGGTTIANGTLAITASNRLGSGNVTIDGGGTLRADAAFTLSKNVALSGGTGSIDTNGSFIAASGVISGPGTLAKTGTNTLVLNGNNTYTGGTTVSGGTLRGTAGTIRGNVAVSALVEFNQNSNGTFSNVIAGTGSVEKSGTATLTLSGANTYSGGTIVSGGGTLRGDTTSLQGNIATTLATDTVNFRQGSDGTYAGVISGSGGLTKDGTSKVTLSGANTYLGTTTVDEGNLAVTGSIAGSVLVNADGTLSGTGITGPVTVFGTVAPGTSVGNLITSDATLGPSAEYDVEIDAGGADLLNVTGQADLNGTINVSFLGGYSPPAATIYTILSASTISSQFSGVNAPPGYAFQTVYTPNEVRLIVLAATPSISTNASADITLGGQVSDTATLAGGRSPTGGITFRAYGPDDASCSGTPVFTDTKTVSGSGNYTSASFTPTQAGTYRWIASYSGDGDNDPDSGACNDPDETVSVAKASPALATNASPGVALGGQISDTATLSGGSSPNGQITFRAYGPDDASCANPPAFTDTVNVSGNGGYDSANFTPTAAGTYRWIASYSGDANHQTATGACNDPNESVTVTSNATPQDPAIEVIGLERDQKAGTATLTVATTVGGNVNFDKTNKVKGFGPVGLAGGGEAELKVVPRNQAAKTLRKKGKVTVNPLIRLVADGGIEVNLRHEFELRQG